MLSTLTHAFEVAWSRRIDEDRRLVGIVDEHHVTILQARYHY
ncbi:MAG TPA: hypothetical protein DIW46_10750 [Microbacterium sp.]|nr:hypothetical protein [Microbacterium sp.]